MTERRMSGFAPQTTGALRGCAAAEERRLRDAAHYFEGGQPAQRTLDGRGVFRDPVFWKAVSLKDDKTIFETLRRWYPCPNPEQVKLVRRAETMGPAALRALLDPGIACRVEAFLSFASDHLASHPTADAPALRQAFSRHLGTTELFRGISIPRQVAEKLSALPEEARTELAFRMGLSQNPTLLKPDRERTREMIDALFAPLRGTRRGAAGVVDLLTKHTSCERTIFTSFSRYLEVAAAVPSQRAPADKEVLVMTMRVPTIAVVEKSGLLSQASTKLQGEFEVLAGDERLSLSPQDAAIEVLTMLHEPSQLVRADVVDRENRGFKLHVKKSAWRERLRDAFFG